MKKMVIIGVAIAALLMNGTLAIALPLSGSVSYPSAISATDGWANASTTMSWNIVQVGSDWQYTYTWSAPSKALSHIIIEVTPGATINDFIFTPGQSNVGVIEVKNHTEQQGNPGLPDPFWGMKINTTGDPLNFSITFTTWRSPVLGDFYAKDGIQNPGQIQVLAYNTGFTLNDVDNSENNHIVVPDGQGVIVPEPGTMILLGLGLLGIGIAVRKRS